MAHMRMALLCMRFPRGALSNNGRVSSCCARAAAFDTAANGEIALLKLGRLCSSGGPLWASVSLLCRLTNSDRPLHVSPLK